MSLLHPQRPIALQQTVNVFAESTSSESPASLEPDNFLAFYLYLYIKISGATLAQLNKEFSNVRFVTVLDPNMGEDTTSDIDPLLFFYLSSLIPKNITDRSTLYQGNKVEGLIRAAQSYGIAITAPDYMIRSEPLEYARAFLDRNREFMAKIYACYLSYALPDRMKESAAGYAEETSKSITFLYMVGILMIEKVLVHKYSTVLNDVHLKNHYEDYCVFKDQCQHLFGKFWVYAGVLSPNLWEEYKRTDGFTHLWIVAGCLADGNEVTFRNISIGGKNIVAYGAESFYKLILERSNPANTNTQPMAVPNKLHARDAVNLINAKHAQWIGSTTSNASQANNDQVSTFDP